MEEANEIIKNEEISHNGQPISWIRVVKADGQYLTIPEDFHPSRLNVELKNGIIVKLVSVW